MKFNEWSRARIDCGRKVITSRKKPHWNDPDVAFILGKLPWGIIRDRLYIPEGADTPKELQEVIDKIFARRGYPVADNEEFYVHILREAHEQTRIERERILLLKIEQRDEIIKKLKEG